MAGLPWAVKWIGDGLIRLMRTDGTKASPGQSTLVERARYPVTYEFVESLLTPPASIPAAEVLALVEELNQEAAGFSDGDASARREIAQRLAKLIPRNPE